MRTIKIKKTVEKDFKIISDKSVKEGEIKVNPKDFDDVLYHFEVKRLAFYEEEK